MAQRRAEGKEWTLGCELRCWGARFLARAERADSPDVYVPGVAEVRRQGFRGGGLELPLCRAMSH